MRKAKTHFDQVAVVEVMRRILEEKDERQEQQTDENNSTSNDAREKLSYGRARTRSLIPNGRGT